MSSTITSRFYTDEINTCDACHRKTNNHTLRGAESTTTALDKWVSLLMLADKRTIIIDYLYNIIEEKSGVKYHISLTTKLKKDGNDGVERTSEPVFRSIKYLATLPTQLNDQITEAYFKIIESLETFMRNGSGWQIDQVTKLEIEIAQFSPIYVSSYIPLPAKLKAKKAILNVQNDDDKCFMWSVLAARHPAKHNPNRVSNYLPYENTLDLSMLVFPTPLSQI